MSYTFTKLFSSITESTIWCEDSDTRVVWITMLAMADRYGRVFGSVPGLANRAQVSVGAVRKALKLFMSPDPDSRSKEYDGRRVGEIEGGWALLNHSKYRDLRDEDERREYKRDWMRNKRAGSKAVVDTSVDIVDDSGLQLTHTDTEADAEADTEVKFNSFWRASWKRGSKVRARGSYSIIAGRHKDLALIEQRAEAQAEAYAEEGTPAKYRTHVVTWLNQRRWEKPLPERDDPDLDSVLNQIEGLV